jgi:hypothetical protein
MRLIIGRLTTGSLVAAALAVLASPPAIADAVAERLVDAGFGDARLLPGIELARVNGRNGERYHVVSGLDRMGGIDEMMDRGDASPAARLIPAAADPDAEGVEAIDEAAVIGLPLDEQLSEADFEDYLVLDRAQVAEMVAADGSVLHILFDLDEETDD